MIVVSILGVIVMLAPNLYKQVRRFFFLNSAKVELQREARSVMELVTRRLRQASSTTLVMDQASGQPYYSRIRFTDIDSNTNVYYQSGKNLVMSVNGSTRTLTSNLRYLAFALPRSDDMNIVSVALTLEKSTYEGQTKALHMASEKVRLIN
ncbi:MAG: hypothetical protein KCHDKBKB_02196 [Elusimicrobia bacterium]|nr:hypothetical protein [Elusimicrobiota bacterium]